MDHHVLCLKFHLDYLQVQTHKDAHALAAKIVAKVENSASHQRVGLQTLNSIMNKLREYQISDDLVDKWYAVLAETSYTGARKQARRRMTLEILQHEFKNNKNSDAGFSLAKVSPFDLSRDRSFFMFRSSRQGFEKLAGRWLEFRPLIFFQQRAGWKGENPAARWLEPVQHPLAVSSKRWLEKILSAV